MKIYELVTHVFEWLRSTIDTYTIPAVCEVLSSWWHMTGWQQQKRRQAETNDCESPGPHRGLGREGTPKTPGEISTKLDSSILSFTFFSLLMLS